MMRVSASGITPIAQVGGHHIPLVVDNEMVKPIENTAEVLKPLLGLGVKEELDKTKQVFIRASKEQ